MVRTSTVQGAQAMSSPRLIPLVRYRYDSLDRLLDCAPADQPVQQRFYQKNRLASEIHGQVSHSYFQQPDSLLAQQQHDGAIHDTTLLASDLQRSVLHALNRSQDQAMAYAPYGHRSPSGGLFSLLGFNGERADPLTGHYLLGNGYRAFNPLLMRFHGPDSMSPFARGGLNAYVYCGGNPINNTDPTGHFPLFKVGILMAVGGGGMIALSLLEKNETAAIATATIGGFFFWGGLAAIGVRALRAPANRSAARRRWARPDLPPSYRDLFGNAPWPPATSRASEASRSLTELPPPSYEQVTRSSRSQASPIELSVMHPPSVMASNNRSTPQGDIATRVQNIRT